ASSAVGELLDQLAELIAGVAEALLLVVVPGLAELALFPLRQEIPGDPAGNAEEAENPHDHAEHQALGPARLRGRAVFSLARRMHLARRRRQDAVRLRRVAGGPAAHRRRLPLAGLQLGGTRDDVVTRRGGRRLIAGR